MIPTPLYRLPKGPQSVDAPCDDSFEKGSTLAAPVSFIDNFQIGLSVVGALHPATTNYFLNNWNLKKKL